MRIKLELASPSDSVKIAALRTEVTLHLTSKYGKGHWSSCPTEKGVLYNLRSSSVYIARKGDTIIATLCLAAKKPWAIDKKYFTHCAKPLYLTNMAVSLAMQRSGIGRFCIDEVKKITRLWPADAIRLDAYNAEAGAGEFYRKCGFKEVGRVSYRNVPLIYFEMMV